MIFTDEQLKHIIKSEIEIKKSVLYTEYGVIGFNQITIDVLLENCWDMGYDKKMEKVGTIFFTAMRYEKELKFNMDISMGIIKKRYMKIVRDNKINDLLND